MHEILHRKHELIDEQKSFMEEKEIMAYERRYEEIIKNGEYIKTFRRMLEYREDHLRFMKEFIVPYTNNKAEKCAE